MTAKPIKKVALFTDIHFGKKNNSTVHNQDCLDFVEWFCEEVKKEPGITHIGFLGDWYENRSAISISTLSYSYKALKMLNDLGLPVLFCVGNHDLYYRHTRDIHSVDMFNEMSNFVVFDKITVIDNTLWAPFLFENEYQDLAAHLNLDYFFGHFEFRGFRLTGYNNIAEHGPDPTLFKGPKGIYSGHYHQRQSQGNVHYIGNTFPMDFSDTADYQRGLCIVDIDKGKHTFTDWPACPKYLKTTLSSIIDNKVTLMPKMYVEATVDQEFTYSQAQDLKDELVKGFELRDFKLDEAAKAVVTEAALDDADITESMSIDEIVVDSIQKMEYSGNIKPDRLSGMYVSLKTGK